MFDGILYCYHDLEKVSFENLYESQGGYSLPEIGLYCCIVNTSICFLSHANQSSVEIKSIK